MLLILLALSIAPGLAIALFVYRKDKLDREPLHLLVKSFFLGALSIIPALILETIASAAGYSDSAGTLSIVGPFALMVGLSEEISKFAFLIWFAYPKKEFNEPFDGITYAVMISMGFATLENVGYVMGEGGGVGVAVLRMFLAVPAHATFAVLMGYFVGLAKFRHHHTGRLKLAGLLIATLFHAAYDFFLFMGNVPFLALGAIASLVLALILSFRAIRIHNLNSPFSKQVVAGEQV